MLGINNNIISEIFAGVLLIGSVLAAVHMPRQLHTD
jgi:Ca2+:H+ antiporter